LNVKGNVTGDKNKNKTRVNVGIAFSIWTIWTISALNVGLYTINFLGFHHNI